MPGARRRMHTRHQPAQPHRPAVPRGVRQPGHRYDLRPDPDRHLQHQAVPPDRPRRRGAFERQSARGGHSGPGGNERRRGGSHRPGPPPQLRLLPELHPPDRSHLLRPGRALPLAHHAELEAVSATPRAEPGPASHRHRRRGAGPRPDDPSLCRPPRDPLGSVRAFACGPGTNHPGRCGNLPGPGRDRGRHERLCRGLLFERAGYHWVTKRLERTISYFAGITSSSAAWRPRGRTAAARG